MTMLSMRRAMALWLALALLSLAGCGNDGTNAGAGTVDASDSASSGDSALGDSGDAIGNGNDGVAAGDALTGDGLTGDAAVGIDPLAWGQSALSALDKPLAKLAEPTLLTTSTFRIAAYFQGDSDLVGGAIFDGTVVLPAAGANAYGKTWQEAVPSESGELPAVGNPNGTIWALCELVLDAPTRVLALADRAYELRWKGGRLPGDIYGSGRMRLPLTLPAGKHVLAVRGRGGQKVRVRFWSVATPLWLDVHDSTTPDLRVGYKAPLWLGMPVLEWDGLFAKDVRARVVGSALIEASEVAWPGLVPGGTTQIGWKIVPKVAPTQTTDGVDDEGKPIAVKVPVTLQVLTDAHDVAWQATAELDVRDGEQSFRQTFRDKADGSVQYYGVRPPKDLDETKKDYALMLTLHGAGVEGIGQASAYGAKTWMWHIAPTNRRPFGFDWEEWGHLNGLHALDDATARFSPDPTQIYLGGHSMGGHGTWQFAVHHAGRFAVVGPSAGWDSFYTYGGAQKPTGPIGRARAHSDTSHFVENLAQRGVYVIHGTADDNVPWSEGKNMLAKVSVFATDVHHHWQDGAGHWWDGDKSPGADCVDWPPLFELMQQRKLDPLELSFRFRSPAPWYSAKHSYATADAASSPMADTVLDSLFDGASLKLTTTNIRRVIIDGKGLRGRGLTEIAVDGKTFALPDGDLVVGPAGGKRVGQSGPLNQVFMRPFALIVPDDGVGQRRIAAWWMVSWQQIGNGHGVVLPASAAQHAIDAGRQLVWFGMAPTLAIDGKDGPLPIGTLPVAIQLPVSDATPGVQVAGAAFAGAAVASVYPRGAGLDAVLWASPDKLGLLYSLVPFSSRSGLPDFVVWDNSGIRATGFWDATWGVNPEFVTGL